MIYLNSQHTVLITLISLTLLFSGCVTKSFPDPNQETRVEDQQMCKSSQNARELMQKPSAASKNDVIRKSRLTSEQADKLSSIVGDSKDFDKQNVVVLPTDIPGNFTVAEFRTWHGCSTRNIGEAVGYYEIVYENSQGACFLVGGGEISPRGEGPENFEKISDITSPALGATSLGFTEGKIVFSGPIGLQLKGRNEYSFSSPFTGAFLHIKDEKEFNRSRSRFENCKMVSPRDAERLVESLQFLNP